MLSQTGNIFLINIFFNSMNFFREDGCINSKQKIMFTSKHNMLCNLMARMMSEPPDSNYVDLCCTSIMQKC